MSAQPPVPQRPARTKDSSAPSAKMDLPKVPPRPTRNFERSISRDRDAASRSPLNDSPFAANGKADALNVKGSSEGPSQGPRRNPSVPSLPLIGQEGMEYASLDNPAEAARPSVAATGAAPQQVSNVAHDLPLHAPKASDAPSTSLNKISAVTGQQKPGDGEHSPAVLSPHGKSRPASAVHTPLERAASRDSHQHQSEDEHGIPSFGVTVPMYPNAGDVQAPGLSAASGSPATGVGFFHSGGSRPPTSEGRRRSMQGFHGPPGSYGLHGHGQLAHDKFEKDWYARHPEEVAKEEHALHVPASIERPAYAMSSDELNQLVRETSRPSSSMGVHSDLMGIPSEAIGYQASEEYSRSHPHTGAALEKSRSRLSRPPSISHVDSPLKNTFSAQDIEQEQKPGADKLHLDLPPVRVDKIGGAGYDPPLEDLGPRGGNTKEKGGWFLEAGDGTPILASDEVAKHPGAEFMQPAVSPAQMLSEDDYFSAHESDHTPFRTKSRSRSRPNSRPGSHDLSRLMTHEHEGVHTPLEDIEEYEPLFEDDEKESKKPKTAVDKLKRPEMDRRRFPSQDIWEDTPTSLQLETTVETPQETVARETRDTKASSTFEPPEKEQLRKGEVVEAERAQISQEHVKAKPKFGAHLRDDRPGMQRFPSQDIWEDTPDSLRLETTVGDMPPDQHSSPSPPKIPARPVRAKAEPAAVQQPGVPQRPERTAERKPPTVSDKPKPQIPVRPTRSPVADEASGSLEEGPTVAKVKPSVPARPAAGSKFATIKAGFLNDLNSRIGLGPQGPPKPAEPEETKEADEDKLPLGDARRGRARGPARRKPAASPGETRPSGWGIAEPWAVWSIPTSGADDLTVSTKSPASALMSKATVTVDAEQLPVASPLARNTAGEALGEPVTASRGASSGAQPQVPYATMDARAHRESEARKEALRSFEEQRIGHAGDVPEPIPEPYAEPSRGASKQTMASTTADEASTAAKAGESIKAIASAAAESIADTVKQMAPEATATSAEDTSTTVTQVKSPMDVVMDDEAAARSSEAPSHTG